MVSLPRAGRLREFFALADVERRAEGLDVEVSASADRDLRRSRQKDLASERLAAHGMDAEALSLAIASFELAVSVAERVPPSSRVGERIERARAALSATKVPDLESDATAEHRRLRDDLIAARRAIEDDLHGVVIGAKGRKRLRVLRATFALLSIAAAVLSVLWAARRRPYVTATASASLNLHTAPLRAVDGEPATEWLLPDRVAGYLEVAPIEPRPIERIKLLNARNAPSHDRATIDFTVEVYVDTKVVKTIDDSFGGISLEPRWKTIELGVPGAHVQKIRLVVRSFHGEGGGLAEVVLE